MDTKGCNIGFIVVAGPTGQYPENNKPTVEYYNGTAYYIKFYADAPYCGILQSNLKSDGGQCVTNIPPFHGNRVTFTEQDCDKPPVQTPMDNMGFLLMGLTFLYVAFHYKCQR